MNGGGRKDAAGGTPAPKPWVSDPNCPKHTFAQRDGEWVARGRISHRLVPYEDLDGTCQDVLEKLLGGAQPDWI